MEHENFNISNVISLLKKCFPLFVSSFLILYIGNASKYAIDALYDEQIQAYYGFISMPIFVVGLINNFIYQPVLTQLSRIWDEKKYAIYLKKIMWQIAIICIIIGLIVGVAYVMGIPVLGILYGVDLTTYKWDLIILIIGGGFLAISGFLTVILTIMRMQKSILFSYSIVSLIAILGATDIVQRYIIRGATLLYLSLMLLLSVILLLIIIAILFYKNKKDM